MNRSIVRPLRAALSALSSFPMRRGSAGAVALFALAACSVGPLERPGTEALRRAVVEDAIRVQRGAVPVTEPEPTPRKASELSFPPARLAELEAMAGPEADARMSDPMLGPDLVGDPTAYAPISLHEALATAVENNLSAEFARVLPGISAQQRLAAEAAFDWTLFADARTARTDQPQAVPTLNGVPLGSSVNSNTTTFFDAGFRKQTTLGGEIAIATDLEIFENRTPGFTLDPDPARSATIDLTLAQPPLRGFGTDVALAEVRLAALGERSNIQELRTTLIGVVLETEAAYWRLAFSRSQLSIARRVLERGIQTREVLRGRLEFDVRPAEFSDAVATVERRRADVMRAELDLRLNSDRLKRLLNDVRYPVGGEVVLLPSDTPPDDPVVYSLFDSLATALVSRPELVQGLLGVSDAAIRETVADNARLPLLDLTARFGLNGIGDDAGEAYDELFEGEFVEYAFGLAFERPLGNHAARALYRQRRLERLQAVTAYQTSLQNVIVEVKAALRELVTNYQLIEQTRTSRLAAAENLRTLMVEEETTRALTPEFLDLKLRRQETLAETELGEALARTDFANSIAALYASMGVSLERRGFDFSVPTDEWLDERLGRLTPLSDR